MTKPGKKTDASSILGAARRAQDVPRPQDVEAKSHTSTLSQDHKFVELQPLTQEKRVNVALRASTHKRLKLLAVQQDRTVQDLVEEISQKYLETQSG